MAKKGLGRGLNVLLGDSEDTAPATSPGSVPPRQTVPLEKIKANPDQPRKHFDEEALAELSDSIKEKGLLQPVLVRPIGDDGNYEIVAGERRWRAAQKAQLHDVPVIIRTFTDVEVAEIAIIENVQRVDLNPMEEAIAYENLMKVHGRTQNNIAQAVGKSRSHVANMIRLNNLPKTVQRFLSAGNLSMGHARALLGAENPEVLAKNIVLQGLSVRETERLIREAGKAEVAKHHIGKLKDAITEETGKKKAVDEAAPNQSADIKAVERDIAEALGLEVSLTHKGKAGSVTIEYLNLDQLDDIVKRLLGSAF